MTIMYCYKCGEIMAETTPLGQNELPKFEAGCNCNVGWHSGRPNINYISRLPQNWHCHTLIKPTK